MGLNKEQIKQEIQKLLDRYNKISSEGRLKSYNEEMTKKDFIIPLFRILGWNVEDSDEVSAEEKISKGRVDYSFRIDGIPKLFLEAKSLKADLDKQEFAEQAINYAWHKGSTWAILTDFEVIKVFNAEWKTENPLQNIFFSISCFEFIEKLDQLLLLSKESLENGLINKEAEKWGKKAKKIPIDRQLLSDLTRFREELTKNIVKNNRERNLDQEELDEAVQRLIDRLIFVRTLEDKQLEPPLLQPIARENRNKKLYRKLAEVFRGLDDVYNSKLFLPHLCEGLVIDDSVLENVITGLFKTSDNAVHYDFSAIDADVLGNIYEQYLGHLLKKTDKRASLTEMESHRKEQGIYYTPTYIVDYIVKNTIGEIAKDKKADLKNIKVLDPACGSGSFLIKAFDYLVTLDKKKNGEISQTKLDLSGASASYGRKTEILKESIFGVDLDPKAVEIAQLNLLLKTAEKKHRLPALQNNIKCGNSLIDDTQIAGKRAFKWEDEFKEIMNGGGFDVVIGNPPYIRIQNLDEKDADFFNEKYVSGKIGNYDIYVLFVERALSLLKEGGYLGLILPNKFFTSKYGEPLRKLISDGNYIYKIVHFGDQQVFDGATTYTCLLFLRKQKNAKFDFIKVNNLEEWRLNKNGCEEGRIDSKSVNSSEWNFIGGKKQSILDKLTLGKIKLKDITETIYQGIITGADKIFILNKENARFFSPQTNKIYNLENDLLHPLLKGSKHIRRYRINKSNKYVLFPYRIINGKAEPISEEELRKKFPNMHNYLLENKDILEKRDSGKMKGKFWYLFSRNQNLARFGQEKIMTPSIAKISSFTYDKKSDYFFVGSGGGGGGAYGILLKNNKLYLPLLAILNSKLVTFFISQTSSKFSGGYFAFNRQYIENIPINIPDNKMSLLSSLADKQITNFERLNKIGDKKTDERELIEKEIKKIDDEINEIVYIIYEITETEKKTIEANYNGKTE